MEACVARKHLKKSGSEDHLKLTSSEAPPQKLTSSEVLKIIRSWKSGSFRFVSNVVLITPIIVEE